jgi:hypothetical protein
MVTCLGEWPAEMGPAPEVLSHAIRLIRRANDREDFRILANALNGRLDVVSNLL